MELLFDHDECDTRSSSSSDAGHTSYDDNTHDPLSRSLQLCSPEDAVRRVVVASRAKQANRLSMIRKNNSERARRYRKRKKERVGNTEGEVEALRAHVAELCARKRFYEERQLAVPFTASTRAVKMVREYFSVFRYGVQMDTSDVSRYPDSTVRPSGGGGGDGGASTAMCLRRQETFLENMAHPEVLFGEFVGVHPLIDQWKKYSYFHRSVRLEFVSFRMTTIDGCPIVSTTGVLHLRYSRRTIEQLFPYACCNEELVQRMIGKEVHLGYNDHFYFDAQGKMIRYELVPDLVSALYEVVGNLQDVALLLGDAFIEQDAVIVQEIRDDESERDPTRSPPIMNIEFILS